MSRIKLTREYFDFNNTRQRINEFISLPHICPFCGKPTNFNILSPGNKYYQENLTDYVAFPLHSTCCEKKCAIGLFAVAYDSAAHISCFPYPSPKGDLPKELNQLSPDFVRIYNQVLYAKSHQLEKLVGIGLSAAIEQLVYDYIIKVLDKKPEMNFAKNIEMLPAGNAQLNASIGKVVRNNQVHPEKKDTSLDINDLFDCVNNIALFFSAEYSTILLENKRKAKSSL